MNNKHILNKNNNWLLKVNTFLCIVFSLIIISCPDRIDLMVDEGTTIVRIYIGENNSSARTVLPVRDAVAGYQLTFSGPSTRAPVNIAEGNSIDIGLVNGTWIVTATAYKLGGVIGNENDAIASGSISVRISNNAISGSVPPIILTQSGSNGSGILNYVISIGTGVSGYLKLFEINGTPISSFGEEGIINLTDSINNNYNIAAGRYIAEVRIENEEGNVAYHREVIEIWKDTTTIFNFAPIIFIDPSMIPVNYSHFNVKSNNHSMIYFSDNILNINGDGVYFIEMKEGVSETTTDRILIASGINADITLTSVKINLSNYTNMNCAFNMTGSTVNLTLHGDNILKSSSANAGLEVPSGSVLVITEASTGTLVASGGNYRSAGIGGSNTRSGGTININGGTITATGTDGAGIGGGGGGSGGVININDGTIIATGNVGIGGGGGGSGGTISINGGTITATGTGGVGIGGGNGGAGGTITSIGGNAVVFTSSIQAELPNNENIGSAIVFNSSHGTMYGDVTLARDITIPTGNAISISKTQTLTIQNDSKLTNNGVIIIVDGGRIIGTVVGNQPIQPSFTISGDTAYSYNGLILTITGDGTYNIGMRNGVTTTVERIMISSGVNANVNLNNVNIDVSNYNNACAFDITNANVNLTLIGENLLKSGANRAGVQVHDGSTLIISETSTGSVTATGGSNSAGIGGSNNSTVGTIKINGGTTTALGGSNGAGIGCGSSGIASSVIINNGTIIATGGNNGAGIGGGSRSSGGTIIISGGTIIANGNTTSGYVTTGTSGIGDGYNYNGIGSTISITGGVITANGGRITVSNSGGAGIGGSSVMINTISGNAIIFASSIQANLPSIDKLGPAIVFNGSHGLMYGNVILSKDVTIPSGRVMGISNTQTLTIQNGSTLTNNGIIIVNDGWNIIGSIAGNQPIQPSFIVTGNSTYNYAGGILTINSNGTYNISMRNGMTSTTVERIVVTPGTSANIILSNVNINVSSLTNTCAFDITGANVNLTLVGENVLRSGANRAGIEVPLNSTLVITEASAGSLNTTGGSEGAGIGGGNSSSSGTININGGTITATGADQGAGIGGGGRGANGGTTNISGGNVTAIGGDRSGTGIGGGSIGSGTSGAGGSGGTINISGGTVYATSGSSLSACIGGSFLGSGGTISITGGTVSAQQSYGIGIGNGSSGRGGVINAISGNAIISATSIDAVLPSLEDIGPAIVFIVNNGTIYGNVTLQQDVTFPVGRILPIPAGQSLTIPSGRTLINNGTINNDGLIYNNGTINNYGMINNSGTGNISGNQVISPLGNMENPIPLLLNTWANGNIPSSGGMQYFKFTANASTQYIHVSFSTLTDLWIQLYDSNFNLVGPRANFYLKGDYRREYWSVTSGQVYYIRVWPYSSSGSGTYRIAYNTSATAPVQ